MPSEMFTFLRAGPPPICWGEEGLFVDEASDRKRAVTDFYFAFDKARELVAADYPPGADCASSSSRATRSLPGGGGGHYSPKLGPQGPRGWRRRWGSQGDELPPT